MGAFRSLDHNETSTALVRTAITLGSILVMSGCSGAGIDISAIQNYAKTTAGASSGFDALADDYYQSCLRTREYSEVTAGGDPLSAPLPDRPARIAVPKPGETPAPFHAGMTDPHCSDASTLAYEWEDENDVVVGYVRSVGKVAGVDTAPTNFDKLGSSLKSVGMANGSATATAAGELAGALVQAREDASLREIAQAAHDHGLPTLASGLETVAKDYQNNLGRERDATAQYYTGLLGREQGAFAALECTLARNKEVSDALNCKSFAPTSSLPLAQRQAEAARLREAIRMQRADRLTELNALDARVAAANDYIAAIRAINDGNDAILKEPGHGLQALSNAVKPYAAAAGDAVSALTADLRK